MDQHDVVLAARHAKEAADKARDAAVLAQGGVDAARASLAAIQRLCSHPRGYRAMYLDFYCPDCFYEKEGGS